MKKLTSKQVQDYMLWRTDEELRQCPDAIAAAWEYLYQHQLQVRVQPYTFL